MPFGGKQVDASAYVELHAVSLSAFWKAPACRKKLRCACASLDMPAMALLDRNGVYGSPRFHMAAKKAGVCAQTSGSEITCSGMDEPIPCWQPHGMGDRNLCRLVTRMKLRAPKGEGANSGRIRRIRAAALSASPDTPTKPC